ncbi:heavy-metal-associated domain-containing protein [Nocardioides sp. KIGAM211]|uniref:Heavy-metal-associated domain-containing protein n=1 Tax=Nocardioides luti TaxID=2761101 RepID=A0A7X0VBA6_9ACTN|nr:cation transporter [Nocardioides luti]MBB6628451.1 heavy-metal-associated domain-containing protein [Nocardioides luti]
MSETTTWTVTGMTCGHCVASVAEEIGELDGVEQVDVVLATGTVTVTSATPLDRERVEAAVTEAGYVLA